MYDVLFINVIIIYSTKQDLCWQLMYPVAEKIPLVGVDIAGTARYSLAILFKVEMALVSLPPC